MRFRGFAPVLCLLVALLDRSSASECDRPLEGLTHLIFDTESWAWTRSGALLQPRELAISQGAVSTDQGLRWFRDPEAGRGSPPGRLQGRRVFRSIRFDPERGTPGEVEGIDGPVPRSLVGSSTWRALRDVDWTAPLATPFHFRGKLVFHTSPDTLTLEHSIVGPPADQQVPLGSSASTADAYTPVQTLRILRSSEGLVAVHSHPYVLSGLMQFSCCAATLMPQGSPSIPISGDWRSEASTLWQQVRAQVGRVFLIQRVQIPARIADGKPFLTRTVFVGGEQGNAAVLRYDYFLTRVTPVNHVLRFEFEMREMRTSAGSDQTFEVDRESTRGATFEFDPRTQHIRREEYRTPNPDLSQSHRRPMFSFPPEQGMVLFHLLEDNPREQAASVVLSNPFPAIEDPYAADLLEWLEAGALERVLQTGGAQALPQLDLLKP